MEKESLEEFKKIIINGLDKNKKTNQKDKAELMMNMSRILKSKEEYEKNIRVLKLVSEKR